MTALQSPKIRGQAGINLRAASALRKSGNPCPQLRRTPYSKNYTRVCLITGPGPWRIKAPRFCRTWIWTLMLSSPRHCLNSRNNLKMKMSRRFTTCTTSEDVIKHLWKFNRSWASSGKHQIMPFFNLGICDLMRTHMTCQRCIPAHLTTVGTRPPSNVPTVSSIAPNTPASAACEKSVTTPRAPWKFTNKHNNTIASRRRAWVVPFSNGLHLINLGKSCIGAKQTLKKGWSKISRDFKVRCGSGKRKKKSLTNWSPCKEMRFSGKPARLMKKLMKSSRRMVRPRRSTRIGMLEFSKKVWKTLRRSNKRSSWSSLKGPIQPRNTSWQKSVKDKKMRPVRRIMRTRWWSLTCTRLKRS